MGKVVIYAPPRAPMGLEECAESFEKTAELLRTAREKGTAPEKHMKDVLGEINEDRSPKAVTEQEYEIIKAIAAAAGTTEYEACLTFETIKAVIMKALAVGEKVKLNTFGTLHTRACPRGSTVSFEPSPILRKQVNR